MKKIISGLLVGLMICGSAFANFVNLTKPGTSMVWRVESEDTNNAILFENGSVFISEAGLQVKVQNSGYYALYHSLIGQGWVETDTNANIPQGLAGTAYAIPYTFALMEDGSFLTTETPNYMTLERGSTSAYTATAESTVLARLQALGNLTFFKNYVDASSLDANFAAGDPTASFSVTRQATNSTYVGDDGIIYTANTAVNRKNNYYDATGFHARSGVLLEPAGTNVLTHSTDFSNAAWAVENGATKAAYGVGVDGGASTALTLTFTASVADGMVQTRTLTATSYTISGYFKTISGTKAFRFKQYDGTTTNYSSEFTATTSWKRFSYVATGTAVSGNIGIRNNAGGTAGDLIIFGLQCEAGSVATSFIPTTTAAVTRAADAPSTYVDASGVIQVNATNNTPRYQGGYYDATGFHAGNKGLMVEGAITNLIPKSNTIDDATWTETNTVASNADAGSTTPFGDATSPSLTASADNGTLLLTTAVTAQTYSVWLKRKTGTGAVSISANSGAGYTEVTLTSDWRRFSVTAASASQTCGIKLATNTDAVYVWGNQFEASPYMTSFIPTTTAAMSRTAEVLKYAISGNRTAASESTFVKFVTWGTGQNGGRTMETETKRRLEQTYPSGHFVSYANVDDSGTSTVDYAASITANTSLVIGCTYKHSSPYVAVYKDGSIGGSDTTHDFTNPSWGTYFYVGNSADSKSLDGVISSIAIFSDAKDATAVSAITGALNA